MGAEVVRIYESNFRAVVGDRLEIFGAGPDAEAPSVAMVFHAAFMRMSGALEAHGR